MTLQKDLKEFVESLNSARVDYVIVGAHALAYHGHPRFTGDLDIAIRASADNAARVFELFLGMELDNVQLKETDFLKPRAVVRFGKSPNRVDLLTSLDGVTFEEIWEGRIQADLDGIPTNIITREHFLRNKRAAGRPQDLADIDALEED